MAVEIRPLTEDRIGDAFWAFATALVVSPPSPERLERRRPGWFVERSFVAHDGPAIVGHVGSLPFQTLVPGGAMVPTAGLTRVGVLGTHRRRGLLTEMMHQSLVQSRERGEILGSLRAAEAAIYGRFGYGLAGLATQVKVRTERSAFAVPVPMAGAMRILQGPELVEHAQRAHARCIRRPGMIDRPVWYWPAVYDAHRDPAPSITEWGVVHYDEAGEPDGFAHWEKIARDDWDGGEASVLVTDLFGIDDEVEATIVRFLLDLDLVDEVRFDNRPTDDPIRHRLVNQRAYETHRVWDEQWVRLNDVRACLAARTYGADERVVLGVTGDRVFPDNVGRFEVSGSGAKRSRRSPDLELPIDALGAVYLGGISFASLVGAGKVDELRPGAASRADALFRTDRATWCGTFF